MATILVVDDEKNYLWMLGELFQNEGHEVLTCEKGSDALTLLRDGQVDLLLTDLRTRNCPGCLHHYHDGIWNDRTGGRGDAVRSL